VIKKRNKWRNLNEKKKKNDRERELEADRHNGTIH